MGYSQSESGYSPLSKSENSRSGNKLDKYESSVDSYQEKLQERASNLARYAKGGSIEEDASGSDQKKSATEFQKAHIRKLQQDRENELYSRFLKQSAQVVKDKWKEERERSAQKNKEYGLDSKSDKQKSPISGYKSPKPQTVSGRSHETYAKFTKIENKISDLERDIEAYQDNLKKKYNIEQESSEKFDKAYDRIDGKVRALKDELDKSLSKYSVSKHETTQEHRTGIMRVKRPKGNRGIGVY